MNLGTWTQYYSVAGNITIFFNHNDGMLLHIMAVRYTRSFSYLDKVLSSVITLYLYCHNAGWLLHTPY